MSSIDTTLLRYHENKISIDSLNLRLDNCLSDEPDHVNRWLQIAVESGVKRLNLLIKNSFVLPQIVFDGKALVDSFVLPQIVFEGKSLVELWLGWCQLKPQIIEIIRCHGLRQLCLFEVRLDELMLQKIISNCPLIDYLEITHCVGLVNIKVTKLQNLKRFSVFLKKSCSIEIEAPSLEDFSYSNVIPDMGDIGHRSLQMFTSQNLKILKLSTIDITDDFFLDITKKFPRLEELEITECYDLQRIKISSHSINRVYLERNWGLKEVQIDAPSIDQFEYIGDFIPRFSFTPISCPSVSDIDLSCWQLDMLETSWLSKLKDMLMELNQSEISLKIEFSKTVAGLIEDEIRNSAILPPLPQVQALNISIGGEDCSDAAYILLDGIFLACRPKTIFQDCYGDSYLKNQLMEVLFEMLLFKRNEKHSNFQQTKFWQRDLKDVKLEIFGNGKRVQQPEHLDWETFLTVPATEKETWWNFVFNLEWELGHWKAAKR